MQCIFEIIAITILLSILDLNILLCIAFRVFSWLEVRGKVEIFWNPAIFWQHVSTYFQNLVMFYFVLLAIWWLLAIFSKEYFL
jgi:hypothetical protein